MLIIVLSLLIIVLSVLIIVTVETHLLSIWLRRWLILKFWNEGPMCTSGVVGLVCSTFITMAIGPVPIRLASSLIVLGGVISMTLHTSSVLVVSTVLKVAKEQHLYAYREKDPRRCSQSSSSPSCCTLTVALATTKISHKIQWNCSKRTPLNWGHPLY